jgi:hypothetical protein
MEGVGANRLRAGRLSRLVPEGESRRLPDDLMLWKGTTLKRFAPFPTTNSVFPMRLSSDVSHGSSWGSHGELTSDYKA